MRPDPPARPVFGERIALVDLTSLGGVHVTNEEMLQREVPLQMDTSRSYAGYFWSRFVANLSETVRFGTVDFDRLAVGDTLIEKRVAVYPATYLTSFYCDWGKQSGLLPSSFFPLPRRGQPIALEAADADLVVLVRQLKIERVEAQRGSRSAGTVSTPCREPDGIGLDVEALVWDNREGALIFAGHVVVITPGNERDVDHSAWENAVEGVVELLVRNARLASRS